GRRREALGGGRPRLQAQPRWLREGGAAVPPLRDHGPLPRPGRRQPHHVLVPRLPAVRRVGHKGADLVAPGNTEASFQAALDAGVDEIEFDVLRLRDGRLVVAHDYGDAAKREPMNREEGLDDLAGEAY